MERQEREVFGSILFNLIAKIELFNQPVIVQNPVNKPQLKVVNISIFVQSQ